jgi:hypothetical protein
MSQRIIRLDSVEKEQVDNSIALLCAVGSRISLSVSIICYYLNFFQITVLITVSIFLIVCVVF